MNNLECVGTRCCEVLGRERIARSEEAIVLCAQIWERVGVESVSITLSPIQ